MMKRQGDASLLSFITHILHSIINGIDEREKSEGYEEIDDQMGVTPILHQFMGCK